jgi:hypothetical protein
MDALIAQTLTIMQRSFMDQMGIFGTAVCVTVAALSFHLL